MTQGPFGRAIGRNAGKLALLEPLTPDTVTVALKCQQFYLRAAPVDKDKPVYIFEGIFDAISSGKTNIIALMGAKLPDERLKELKYPVFCLDNDRTGKMNAIQYAKQGHQIYVQPKQYSEKDFNELMWNNPDLDLPKLIDDNLFVGIGAELRLKVSL